VGFGLALPPTPQQEELAERHSERREQQAAEDREARIRDEVDLPVPEQAVREKARAAEEAERRKAEEKEFAEVPDEPARNVVKQALQVGGESKEVVMVQCVEAHRVECW
jgi:hypothetical protein